MCTQLLCQVQQLPPKALSYQEHFQRVASAVALPCALGLLYWVALAAVGFMDGFDRRRVKHLEDTKRAMIKELKVCLTCGQRGCAHGPKKCGGLAHTWQLLAVPLHCSQ